MIGRLNHVAIAVKDLATGRVIEIRGDVVFPQASAIKLALIYELYQQAGAGRVDLNSLRPLPKVRVGGSGVLPFLSDKAQLTVRDLGASLQSMLAVLTIAARSLTRELAGSIQSVGTDAALSTPAPTLVTSAGS